MFKEVDTVTIKYPELFRKHFSRAFGGTLYCGLRGTVESALKGKEKDNTITLTTADMPREKITQVAMFEDLMEGMTPYDFFTKWKVRPQNAAPLAYMVFGLYPEVRVALWRFMGSISSDLEDLDAVRLPYHIARCGEQYIPVVDDPVLFRQMDVELEGETFHLPAGQGASADADYCVFVEDNGTPRLPPIQNGSWSPHLRAESGPRITAVKNKDGAAFAAPITGDHH